MEIQDTLSVSKQEYQTRRLTLARRLPPDSIALIPAATTCSRNADASYRFRQDSDMVYLTGFTEPDALLVITSGPTSHSVLFNRPRHPVEELWNGKRLGQDDAMAVLGVDEAFSLDGVEEQLPALLEGKETIYFAFQRYPQWEQRVYQILSRMKKQIRQGIHNPELLGDLDPILSEMRLIKSPKEIAIMQHAAKLSVAAHRRVMQACSRLEYEYQLEAEFLHELMRHGCRNVAYDSIVASGANACILHYTENNQPLHDGDLILIDAGGEFEHYAADITRTYPKNGRFTGEQRALYELVLQAQQAGIRSIKPGVAWNVIQHTIIRVLTSGLKDLGILQGDVDGLIESKAFRSFYMHNSGHWLGLDVHDCGRYKSANQWRLLEPGMVLTVEPGLYMSTAPTGINSRWSGIGVRIEDDILVTESGYMNLTAELPVEISELEVIIRGH